jgi:hypothetical protein
MEQWEPWVCRAASSVPASDPAAPLNTHREGNPLSRYRWAWFALACLVAAGWAWTDRYEYHDCRRGVCVAVNRWTGEIHRAETAIVAARREQASHAEE